ncbi:MAG: hypothetical protein BWX57_00423 [Tenericutes bacterium ADurb.Bin024]|nr:MAG: hypothetical protein BWX57_00423 [Tenericutes bacterium ADurb.Bin024]
MVKKVGNKMVKKLVLYSNDDIIEIYGGPKGFLEAWGEHGELEGLTEEEIQEIAEEYLETNYEVIEDILWYDCERELKAKNGRVVVGGYQHHHYAGYLPHYVNTDFYILEDNALKAVYDENADFVTIYQEGEALKVEITTHDYTHIKEIKLLTDEGIKFIRDLSEEYLYPGFEDLEMLFNDSEYSKDFFDEGRAFLTEAKELEDEDEDLLVEELKRELKEMCEKTDTSISGMEYLIKYYMESLHWTEIESITYAMGLFKNGTIQQIKSLNSNDFLAEAKELEDEDEVWRSVKLDRITAEEFKKFLKDNGIYFEPSEDGNLVHFELLVSQEEENLCNTFLGKVNSRVTRQFEACGGKKSKKVVRMKKRNVNEAELSEDEDLLEEELVEVPEDQWGEDYELDYESFIDVNEQQETLSFIETGYLLDLKDPENFSNLKIIPDEMKRFDRLHAYGTRDQWSYNDTEEAIADAKQIVNELEPYEYIVVSVFPSSKLRKDTSRRYIAPKAFEVDGIKFKYPYMADYSNKDKVTFYDIGDIPRRQKRVQYIIYSCMNDGQGNIVENFIYKQRQYKSRQLRNQ